MTWRYNFTVEHRPAARHQSADALSRCPDGRRLAVSTSDLDKDVVVGIFSDSWRERRVSPLVDGRLGARRSGPRHGRRPSPAGRFAFCANWLACEMSGRTFPTVFLNSGRVDGGAPLLYVRRSRRHSCQFDSGGASGFSIQDLHVGLGKASAVCRLCLWFPDWRAAARDAVRTCTSCQLTRPSPPRDKTATWPPAGPWERLHVDFSELDKRTFFVIFDAVVADWTNGPKTSEAIRVLCTAFRAHGCARLLSPTTVQLLPQRISTPFYVTAASHR